MIHHAEHQRRVDLDGHAVEQVGKPQLVRVVQHGGELRSHDLGIGELRVGDDTDIGVFLHEKQQIAEAHGRVFVQDGR